MVKSRARKAQITKRNEKNIRKLTKVLRKVVKKNKVLVPKVLTLMHLRNLSAISPPYAELAKVAGENLGGAPGSLNEALRWLDTNAMETTEEGVVGEVNFVRDLLDPTVQCPLCHVYAFVMLRSTSDDPSIGPHHNSQGMPCEACGGKV